MFRNFWHDGGMRRDVPVRCLGLVAMALAVAWAVPGFAQISFDASSTTGGAIRPGFATTCNAAALGALRTNAGALERCNGAAWGAVGGVSTTDRIVSTSANIVVGNGGTISFTTGGVSGTAYFDTVGRLVAPGISTTGAISGTALVANALTVNGVAITGSGVDDVPAAFDFTNVVSASTATSVSSNIITLSGLGTVPVVAVTGGISSTRISVDGGAWVRQAVVGQGQTVQAWVSSSAATNSTTVSFITIGSVSDTWAVTTINCPGGWTEWNGKCYIYNATTRTYAAARTYCQGLTAGADVATPDSSSENTFLYSMNSSSWLGLDDIAVEATWRTPSGALATYFNWGSGQPDNSGGNEDCVVFPNAITWNDLGCGSTRSVICER